MPGQIEDRWISKRTKERTKRHGIGQRYRVKGIPNVRSMSFDRLVDAKKWLADAQADVSRGTYADPRDGEITLGAYARTVWLPTRTVSTRTLNGYRDHVENKIIPTLGDLPLNMIKAAHIRAWVAEISTRLAPSTVRKSLTILRDILGTAAADRLIPRSPASRQDRITAPQIPETKRIPWTKERATKVRDALPDFYRILVPLGIGLGLRQGEVFGLSMDDFNDDGTVSIRRQLCDANGKRYFALPKGGKARTIPVPRALRELVKQHAEEHPSVEVKLPWATPDGRPITVRALITTKRKCPVAVNYFNANVWKPALAQAGVISSETRRRASSGKLYSPAPENGFHVLRHTYASIMLQAGEPVHAVARWLGHSDPAITLRVYAHLMPEAGERGISALEDDWL